MKLIDRFTLDDASAKVWWPAALVALIALVLTVPGGNRAAEDVRAAAAARAATASTSVIQPMLKNGATFSDVSVTLKRLVASDPAWSAARVWDQHFSLFASSNDTDPVNSAGWVNDPQLRAAVRDGTYRYVTDRLPTNDPGPTTFHAYTRVSSVVPGDEWVTEFEARDSVLLAEVHEEWLGYRIVLFLATLLLLSLAFLSMREPRAPIGTNVPFYPESLPAEVAIVDVDRAVELDQADSRIQDRISALQERLDESERLRRKADAQLQQALTALGSGGRSMTVPRPAATPAPDSEPQTPTPRRAPAAPAAGQPAPVQRPAPTPKPAAAPAPKPAAAPAPKPAAAPAPKPAAAPAPKPAAAPAPQPTRRQAPQPQPAAAPQPVARRKKPTTPAQPVAKPAVQTPAAKAPPPPVTTPAPVAKAPPPPPQRAGKHVAPEPVTVASDDVSITATPTDGTDAKKGAEVVVVPEPEKARAGAKRRGRDIDDEVLDVLNRLVPSPDDPHPLEEPGDLRARLARTAALKKPGSRERQEERAKREGPAQQ